MEFVFSGSLFACWAMSLLRTTPALASAKTGMIRNVTLGWSACSNWYKFTYDSSTFHSRSFIAVALTKIHLRNMLGERED